MNFDFFGAYRRKKIFNQFKVALGGRRSEGLGSGKGNGNGILRGRE